MMRDHRKMQLICLRGRGWSAISESVVIIRLRDRPGFAVGVQGRFRSSGIGRVWPGLKRARRRAIELAAINSLPVVESI